MKVANCCFDVVVTVSKHTNKSERATSALGSMKKEFRAASNPLRAFCVCMFRLLIIFINGIPTPALAGASS